MASTTPDSQVIQSLTPLATLIPGRYFRVPDYQRGYAWEEIQVKALLQDLQVLAESQHSGLHYTGTLVLVPGPGHTPERPVYDIVDGQQRLTTLNMLLNILIGLVEKAEGVKPGESDLYQSFIGRGSTLRGYRYVLQLNSDNEGFFRALMKGEADKRVVEYLSQKHLRTAYQQMSDWADKHADSSGKALAWIELITTRLGLIAYQPQDANEAGMMFEVINNRGKPLTELEKVKNYLIYYAIKKQFAGLQETINEKWGDILRNLAQAHHMADIDRQQLLRSAVVVYFGFRKQESNAAYNKLKAVFSLRSGGESEANKLKEFVEFLSDCSLYYETLFNRKSTYRHDNKTNRNAVTEIIAMIRSQTAHSGILPLYLCVMWLYGKKHISSDQLLRLLHRIERANFRVYMLPVGGARADSGHGMIFNIAHNLYAKVVKATGDSAQDDINAAVNSCQAALVDFTKHHGHKTLDAFKASFRLNPLDQNMDFYHWRGLRYFLANYEQALDPTRTSIIDLQLKANKANRHNDYFQIEHIYARGCPLQGPDPQQTSHQKRRLGNLMLLEWGVNGSVSNKPIEEKLQDLQQNGSSTKRATLAQVNEVIKDCRQVFGQSGLETTGAVSPEARFEKYIDLLDRIENRMIRFAGERWAFESEPGDSGKAQHV
ncbi:MAG: DUF262 domain-containing protein [Oceanospirillaceae bacterium]|nr:DUF262 domain-containing protein [Oceanospirillaceae bacterium]